MQRYDSPESWDSRYLAKYKRKEETFLESSVMSYGINMKFFRCQFQETLECTVANDRTLAHKRDETQNKTPSFMPFRSM